MHKRTHTSPHAAWNSNKALPYCCQGNMVGSNQLSGLYCSRLRTPPPLTPLSHIHIISVSLPPSVLLILCSSYLKPLVHHFLGRRHIPAAGPSDEIQACKKRTPILLLKDQKLRYIWEIKNGGLKVIFPVLAPSVETRRHDIQMKVRACFNVKV